MTDNQPDLKFETFADGAEVQIKGVPDVLSPYIDLTDGVENNPRLVFWTYEDDEYNIEDVGDGLMKITAELPDSTPDEDTTE